MVWEDWVVWVVRVVFRKKLIAPPLPNLTHYLTLPLAAGNKKEFKLKPAKSKPFYVKKNPKNA